MKKEPTSRPQLTPAIVKAARALLELTQIEFAERVGLSISTLRRFESGHGFDMSRANKEKMFHFLTENGIDILKEDGQLEGVIRNNAQAVSETAP